MNKIIVFALSLMVGLVSYGKGEKQVGDKNSSNPLFKVKKGKETLFPGKKTDFHGFTMYEDKFFKIAIPKKIADGKPWVLRARFWGLEPQFDIAMLNKGYHIAFYSVKNMLGSPKAIARWNDLYEYLRVKHSFSERVVLEGMSRGGLPIYNWAAANPDKVAAIYGDAPVLDFKSWPGGKGESRGNGAVWRICLKSYVLTEKEALAYTKNPIDNLAPLAKAGIPIIHVVGDVDEVVPVAENTAIAVKRYKALGGTLKVIHKPKGGHHPHSLKDPSEIVEFIVKHSLGVAAP